MHKHTSLRNGSKSTIAVLKIQLHIHDNDIDRAERECVIKMNLFENRM